MSQVGWQNGVGKKRAYFLHPMPGGHGHQLYLWSHLACCCVCSFSKAVTLSLVPFMIGDIIKLIVAALACPQHEI